MGDGCESGINSKARGAALGGRGFHLPVLSWLAQVHRSAVTAPPPAICMAVYRQGT